MNTTDKTYKKSLSKIYVICYRGIFITAGFSEQNIRASSKNGLARRPRKSCESEKLTNDGMHTDV
jgi:hypothetical protein